MTDADEKTKQASYYDHEVEVEFETNRPHGAGSLYGYLMDYKFQRVQAMLDSDLAGKSVLDICCGSGMDAEYLARAGAQVTALDISPGAIDRARARAERFGVRYELVVGDAEDLPFPDLSFDYVFVHDGLHHLPEPRVAIQEMARVARRGLIITEPAQAALTQMLIRIGIMKPYEDAGNFVVRFSAAELESLVVGGGFRRIRSARYLVKYGHPPPEWWRAFDTPPLFTVAKAVFQVFGVVLFGPLGNKLAFVAQRDVPIAPNQT